MRYLDDCVSGEYRTGARKLRQNSFASSMSVVTIDRGNLRGIVGSNDARSGTFR
jgi:hypothetical protein